MLIRNLWTDPKPSPSMQIMELNRVTASFPGSGMLLIQTSSSLPGNGAFAKIKLPTLDAGTTYRLEADMIPSSTVRPPSNLGRTMLMAAEINSLSFIAGDNAVSDGRRTCTFTARPNTNYCAVLCAGDGSGDTSMSVLWSNILLMTATDHQTMRSLGLDWFDGSLMPLA